MVPLMSMVRTRQAAQATTPMTLVAVTRSPETLMYGAELAALTTRRRRARRRDPLHAGGPGRRTLGTWDDSMQPLSPGLVLPAEHAPWCFVCGPTGFVEATIAHLVAAGHDPGRIKAERFGGTG